MQLLIIQKSKILKIENYSGDPKTEHSNTGNIRKPETFENRTFWRLVHTIRKPNEKRPVFEW